MSYQLPLYWETSFAVYCPPPPAKYDSKNESKKKKKITLRKRRAVKKKRKKKKWKKKVLLFVTIAAGILHSHVGDVSVLGASTERFIRRSERCRKESTRDLFRFRIQSLSLTRGQPVQEGRRLLAWCQSAVSHWFGKCHTALFVDTQTRHRTHNSAFSRPISVQRNH